MGKNVTTGSGTTTVGGKVVQTAGSGTKYVPSYLGRDPLVKLVGGTYRIVTDPRAKVMLKRSSVCYFSISFSSRSSFHRCITGW